MKQAIKSYFLDQAVFLIAMVILMVISMMLTMLENDANYLYLGVLMVFVFGLAGVVHFVKMLPLYQGAMLKIDNADDFCIAGQGALSKALQNQTTELESCYEGRIHRLKDETERYQLIMNQWVHQMKTPVAVLNLMAQEKGAVSSAMLMKELARIEYGLNQVLYLLRTEKMEKDLVIAPVSLKAVVRDAVNDQKQFFIQKEVYPKISIEDDLIIYTDKKWLTFALAQIINNAVKYSESGQVVRMTAEREAKNIILHICDNGIGIEKEDLPRIFEWCFTGANGRVKQKESSGFGLSMAKKILDDLGHSVSVVSEVGKGTCVNIAF